MKALKTYLDQMARPQEFGSFVQETELINNNKNLVHANAIYLPYNVIMTFLEAKDENADATFKNAIFELTWHHLYNEYQSLSANQYRIVILNINEIINASIRREDANANIKIEDEKNLLKKYKGLHTARTIVFNNKDAKVTILVGALFESSPTIYMNNVVSSFCEGKQCLEFVESTMDNTWTRIIVEGINNLL